MSGRWAPAVAVGADMRQPALLLILACVWLYAPDMAIALDQDPSGAMYQSNGLYGAALAAYALDAIARPRPGSRLVECATLALSAVLWSLQYACDLFYVKGAPSAAICDDVTGRPINMICAVALLAVAALADKYRGRDA